MFNLVIDCICAMFVVQCCAVLCCAVLCCAVLCCAVLCCAVHVLCISSTLQAWQRTSWLVGRLQLRSDQQAAIIAGNSLFKHLVGSPA
jgi:hypothetical protein